MRGSVNQRGKDTWQIRYDAPPTGNRRRKYLAETVKGTKKAAERVLRERLAAIDGKAYVPRHRETITMFLERWLATYAASNTSLRTQQGYRGIIRSTSCQ